MPLNNVTTSLKSLHSFFFSSSYHVPTWSLLQKYKHGSFSQTSCSCLGSLTCSADQLPPGRSLLFPGAIVSFSSASSPVLLERVHIETVSFCLNWNYETPHYFSWLIHADVWSSSALSCFTKSTASTICLSLTSWSSFLPFSLHVFWEELTNTTSVVPWHLRLLARSDLLLLTSLIKTNVFADVGLLSLAVINCLLFFGKHLQPHSNLF